MNKVAIILSVMVAAALARPQIPAVHHGATPNLFGQPRPVLGFGMN